MKAATYPVPAPAGVRSALALMLDEAATAYNDGDYEAFVAAYLPSPETTLIAYEPGEGPVADRGRLVLRGSDAIRAHYAEAPMFDADFKRPTLSYDLLHADLVSPEMAHVVAFAQLSGGDDRVPKQAISSLILRREKTRWRITHDHTH
ncbi:nuclear transport factor 2 family protein [Sphaerisporangium corydalis]|uniref:Nuclear transport factor 2 family protein n=1 Tax=Sphaerisporangium corydalis TaxID=1441875 RepID=A0ABV9EQU7_9ACTN|nr:nuclear transport factor 2 family protein [Sphaerisporangium corydalis]